MLPQRVPIGIYEADWFVGVGDTTPVAALPLCGANHKSTSPDVVLYRNLFDKPIR